MLPKPLKKTSKKDPLPPKKSPLHPYKLLNRQLSHVILTQPKIRHHKRQSSCAPTNNQSTSQKVSIAIDGTNRKLVDNSSKKMGTKSKKSIKSPIGKKFESYLLYIDTQFSLFSEHTKSKLSDYSTDVKKEIEEIDEKDDMIELIKRYKRDYIKEKQSREDKAADNIKSKWKVFRTRKLISKFVKINKIKQRPENIPSNINKVGVQHGLRQMQSMLSVETIKSEFECQEMGYLMSSEGSAEKEKIKAKSNVITVPSMPCIENIKIKEIEGIMLKKKQTIASKHFQQLKQLETKYKNKQMSKFQYEKSVKNANTFVGIRYSEINESILNVRKLVNQTDGLLHQLQSHNVINRTPLRCQSENKIMMTYSEQSKNSHKQSIDFPIKNQLSISNFKVKQNECNQESPPNSKEKIIQQLVDELVFEFCKESQLYPYIQKIMIQCFADWKIGVECNEDAVDLFCQNVIQYALSSNPSPFENLKIALGCSSTQLLKLHHSQSFESEKEQDVIPDKVFKDFSKLMVFPLKSKNSPKQLSIIKLIEVLNHYHNLAIFEALNQALDYERVYGIVGKPLPWLPEPNFKKLHIYQSLSSAVDKVMGYQQWRLGFHPENFFGIRPDLTLRNLNMFRDEKLNRLMEFQQKELEVYWQNDQMQRTFFMLDITYFVENYILYQICKQLKTISRRKE